MNNSKLLKYLLLILFLPIAGYAQLKVDGLLISAENYSQDSKKATITVEKNIIIAFKDLQLYADKAVIYTKENRIIASGNVVLTSEKIYSEAESLVYDYKKHLGVYTKGFIQSGQVLFQGDTIEKIDLATYKATNARYTACDSCPSAWEFSGTEIVAEIGGYAYIKFPILRVVNIPILILPSIAVPLKSTRESGLLQPEFEVDSTGGAAISQSYFWAISRSKDLTYTFKNYEKRGVKNIIEYRYLLDKKSEGTLNAAFLNDRSFVTSDGLDETRKRWFLTYDHKYFLPNRFIQKTNLNVITDLRYLKDFPDDLKGYGSPSLENRFSISKNWENLHFSGETIYNINLLKTNPLEGNSDAIHRAPEIRYSLTQRKIADTGILFKGDFNYVNFARNGFSYDDIKTNSDYQNEVDAKCASLIANEEAYRICANKITRIKDVRDGIYTPGLDIIRTGHRGGVFAEISKPFYLSRYFNITPHMSYQETHYRFNTDLQSNTTTSAARKNLQTNITFKTEFTKVYKPENFNKRSTTFLHKIEPAVGYSQVLWAQRSDHEFFGDFSKLPFDRSNDSLSEDDFFDADGTAGIGKVQFDYDDRLYDKRIMSFGVLNKITRKRWVGNTPIYKNIATFKLSNFYDFNEAETGADSQPWSIINAVADLRFDNFDTYTSVDYYSYLSIANLSSRFKFFNDLGNYFQISYKNTYKVNDDNQIEKDARNQTIGASLGFVQKYIHLNGGINYSNTTYKVDSWEYNAKFTPPGNCWGILIKHKQVIGSDPFFKISLEFKFGGVKS